MPPQGQQPTANNSTLQHVWDVPLGDIPFVWPEVSPHIKRALDRDGSGRYLPDDILKSLLDGKCRLWIAWNHKAKAIEAAIVTQILIYPRMKELRLWLIGGTGLSRWGREARDTLEAFARAEGCVLMSGGLRKGWMRIGGAGWKSTGIMFEKRLT